WRYAAFGQRLLGQLRMSVCVLLGREGGRMVQHDPRAELVVVGSRGLHHRAPFDPIAEDRLRHVDGTESALGGADPEVPILVAEYHVRVVAAYLLPDRTPVQRRAASAIEPPQMDEIKRPHAPDALLGPE